MKSFLSTKIIAASVALLSLTNLAFSQNVGINATGASAHASSMLDITSTTKGLLIPRMTSAQRTAIVTPATGLTVYDTTLGGFYYYNGTIWVMLLNSNTGWSLLGNTGTNPTNNFVGTTDAVDFVTRTNNAERIRVLSSGNVGIGTNAPVSRLEVRNDASATAISLTNGTGGIGNQTGLDFYTYSGFGATARFGVLDAGDFSNHILFSVKQPGATTNSLVERMRITSNGNVGIGNSNPTATLDVVGTFKLADGNQASGRVLTSDAFGNATWAVPSSSSSDWTLLGNTGTNATNNFIGTTDAIDLVVRTNNTEKMRITNSGSVGIGTSAPATRLEVGANGAASEVITVKSANSFAGLELRGDAANTTGGSEPGGAYIRLFQDGTAVEGIIGTVQNTNTDGAGGAYNGTLANALLVGHKYNLSSLQFGANSDVKMTIEPGGDVGIGTTNPGAKLEIAGQVKITGGAPGIGKVLTSDATGLATWVVPGTATGGWDILGNAGTVDGTTFIGTTDNVPLNLRVNNLKAGRINLNGQTVFGLEAANVNTSTNITAVGYNALNANTTGDLNTAIGNGSMFKNNTGYSNSAVGAMSLLNNTIGYGNVAIGAEVLFNNTSGYYNTASGYLSMRANTTGRENTANGANALNAVTIGSFNSAQGSTALLLSTSGSYNTANGYDALSVNLTGSNNTGIGAGANVSTNNLNNATAIGFFAIANASNKVRVGNTTVTVCEVPVAWTVASDKTLKTNVKQNVPGLDFIKKLEPVTYQYKAHGEDAPRFTGLMAQDVDKILTDLKYDSIIVTKPNDDGTGSWGIKYAELTMPLIKAVQEQQQIIEEMKKEIEILKNKISN